MILFLSAVGLIASAIGLFVSANARKTPQLRTFEPRATAPPNLCEASVPSEESEPVLVTPAPTLSLWSEQQALPRFGGIPAVGNPAVQEKVFQRAPPPGSRADEDRVSRSNRAAQLLREQLNAGVH
jgi:hypothetical protein